MLLFAVEWLLVRLSMEISALITFRPNLPVGDVGYTTRNPVKKQKFQFFPKQFHMPATNTSSSSSVSCVV
jgi:hypothetical protein